MINKYSITPKTKSIQNTDLENTPIIKVDYYPNPKPNPNPNPNLLDKNIKRDIKEKCRIIGLKLRSNIAIIYAIKSFENK